MNNELERMWKEEVLACFNVRFRHLLKGTEESHESFSEDSR